MTDVPLFLPVPERLPAVPPPGPAEWTTDGEGVRVCFIVGVDLGQARDYSAVVIDEASFVPRITWQRAKFQAVAGELRREQVVHHRIRHIERIPLGTSYPDVIARVASMLGRLPRMPRDPVLVMDATGCGRPVIDLARKSDLAPIAVTITAGEGETIGRREARVAKRILASTVAVLLETERVRVVATGPDVAVLRDELRQFRVKVNVATGAETFEAWREAEHDDLVLAAALALWAGERLRERVRVNPNWSLPGR